MTAKPIDYFAPSTNLEEAIIRRIMGDCRKAFIAEDIKQDGLDSIPPESMAHGRRGKFSRMVDGEGWRSRSGEDLPDLEEGEVEIARVALANSVHGEVTSLRVRRKGSVMLLRLVDEYQREFEVPFSEIAQPFTAGALIEWLAGCDPCPFEPECELRIASPFYEGLQQLLDDHLKRALE